MKVHANAALGPAGRLALVQAIESGMTQKAAAAAFCVAPATAHRWWHRWRLADEEQRSSGRWLLDRSSRPHRQPRRLSAAEEAPILRARRQTNLGPGRLAGNMPPGSLDDLEGSPPPRALPATQGRQGDLPPL